MPHPAGERYPPIGDYAIIGDARTCALVSRDGSIDWMCLPDFDSPSYFGRLLDWDRGGHFRVAPADPYTSDRRYVDGTNVLETTFSTATGQVALIDFLPALTEDEKRRELQPLRSLVRIVEGRTGTVPMRLEYVPRPAFAGEGVRLIAHGAREVTSMRGAHITHLRSGTPLDAGRRDARAAFDVAVGQRVAFSLAYSLGEPAVIVSDSYAEQTLARSLSFWRDWSSQCTYDGPYRQHVVRSALALKLLTYAPSGAIVASPTTSLPEVIGGERNYDYRYCWLRDAAFIVDALQNIGYEDEAQAFVGWLLHATRLTAPRLHPLYTLLGETHIPERELPHFEGYRGSKPVRIGNAAAEQAQFDVYGEVVQAFHRYVSHSGCHISSDESRLMSRIADHAAEIWREPDNGIWEPRRPKQHYTHSKVMLWDALESAIDLARAGHIKGDSARWQHEAAAIRNEVLTRGYNERVGAFTQTLDGDALDASLLALPLVRFIEADDPRMLSTIDAIRAQLDDHGFLRRYHPTTDDGFTGVEGAFVICNFWLAGALAMAGRVDDARAVFERTLGAANDVGLIAEQVDPASGDALGNMPQGLSHIELIGAALAIARAERRDVGAKTGVTAADG
jgi:GH15 family glucan-1,4-alpha-glucosidase